MISNKRQIPPHIGRANIQHDQFFTKDSVAKFCVSQLNLKHYDAIIEPSAGDGAFCRYIKPPLSPTLHAIDIDPKADNIIKQDFFHFKIDSAYKNVLVVGNPPFGIHHKLSDAFLEHSFSFANVKTIAFILPNTYYKHTRQKILPPDFRIKAIYDIGKDAFIHDGKEYHVPCSFFIFDRSQGKDLRMRPDIYKETADFSFGSKDDSAFFIFGANPARIIDSPTPNNRGYFIKPKIDKAELIERLKSVEWHGNSCANGGVAWFSKPEVIMQYRAVYG